MPRLARVLEFLALRLRSHFPDAFKPDAFKQDVTNEVSEYEGSLLVRLGRGSAMQLQLSPDRTTVVFRIVPIAKARRLDLELPWHVAGDTQLRGWLEPESAIGQWLVKQGLLRQGLPTSNTGAGQGATRLDERAVPVMSLP
jgi:hypothetical protein